MNADYQRAVEGTLCSTNRGNPSEFIIGNGLPVPLQVYWLSATGEQVSVMTSPWPVAISLPLILQPKGTATFKATPDGYWWLLAAQGSGAFAAVVGKERESAGRSYVAEQRVAVSAEELVPSGAIGMPPTPNSEVLMPSASPRILVACGPGPSGGGTTILVEQQWQLSSGSYALAPHERRTISYTETSGMESTSAESSTVATSLGLSASAGWGAISASVSMSVSTSSSRFEEVTISSDSTEFTSTEIENETSTTQLVLLWQLMQTATVVESRNKPTASVVSALGPAIPQLSTLERLPPPTALEAERLLVPELSDTSD